MATKTTTKDDQKTPEGKLKDVNVLNDAPDGAIGVIYITQGMRDKLQDLVDRMSLQVTRNLLWIGIMTTAGDDVVPSFEDVFGKYYAMATSPEAYLFVGFRSDNDGSYRTPVSQGQYDKIVQNSEAVLRDIADLKEFKLNGFEPSMSRGGAYEQVANERKKWLADRSTNQRNREVANAVAAKEAAQNMPAPF
jgi:vacuolar-type H+-ATPase subunit F/Vma7